MSKIEPLILKTEFICKEKNPESSINLSTNNYNSKIKTMIDDPYPTKDDVSKKTSLISSSGNCVQLLEKLGCKVSPLGNLYAKIFYKSRAESEIKLTDLDKNSSILVIGSGPLPSTGIFLARKGYKVTCVDKDDTAIKYAKKYLNNMKEDLGIKIVKEKGEDIDYSNYDAVWIALHVSSKSEILSKALKEIKQGGKIVFRNPRGILKRLYPTIDIPSFGGEHKVREQSIEQESILIIKKKKDETMNIEKNRSEKYNAKFDKNLCICDLYCGQEATILTSPNNLTLNALGMRYGKKIRFESKQPLGGPFLVSINGRRIAIDKEIAEMVLVG